MRLSSINAHKIVYRVKHNNHLTFSRSYSFVDSSPIEKLITLSGSWDQAIHISILFDQNPSSWNLIIFLSFVRIILDKLIYAHLYWINAINSLILNKLDLNTETVNSLNNLNSFWLLTLFIQRNTGRDTKIGHFVWYHLEMCFMLELPFPLNDIVMTFLLIQNLMTKRRVLGWL